MGKRIRYPKDKLKEKELKKEQKQEEPKEQKKHFVLDVHDSNLSDLTNFGH